MKQLSTFVVAACLGILVSVPRISHADASCTSLLSSKYSYLQAHGGWWNYEFSLTVDGSGQNVRYTRGTFVISGSNLVDSGETHLYSDRYNGSQPFDIYSPTSVTLTLTQGGQLWVYDNTYGYYLLNDGDMSCAGGVVTKYINSAVFTIVFRTWGNIP